MTSAGQQQVVERLGGALTQAGMPRTPARVLAALLVDDDGRMTAGELATSLQLSPGSVSAAVSYLERIGVLRRERERGSRRDVYVVEEDAWHGVMTRSDQLYRPIIAALDAGATAVEADSPAYRRLRLSVEFLEFVSAEMAVLRERWEQRRRMLADPPVGSARSAGDTRARPPGPARAGTTGVPHAGEPDAARRG